MRTANTFRIRDSRDVFIAAGAAIIALAVLYRDTIAVIVNLWWQFDAYQHGFVVVPIVLWLVWGQRAELARLPVAPSVIGLVGLAAAGFIWLLGVIAHAGVVTHFAIIAMIIAVVPAVAGLQIARHLAFPLGFLFFAVPFGEFMVPTLMDWTADFTVSALRATGVPVFREGNDFVIPSGRWSVVQECSGIRYFHAALMGGALFAYLVYRSTARRVAFIAFSIVAPIIANWLRAYLTVLLGHLTNNRLAVGVDHLLYGWLFFGIVIFIIFWVGVRWREDGDAYATLPGTARFNHAMASRSHLWMMTAALLAIGIVWLPVAQAIQARLDAFVPVFSAHEIGAEGWRPIESATAWKPLLSGARSEIRKTFARGDDRAGVHVAWFYGEQDGAKLVSSQNAVADRKAGWRLIERGPATVPWRGTTRAVTRSLLANGAERIEVYSFYWIAGFATASDPMASAMLAVAKLFLLRSDAARVLMFAPADPNGASALAEFSAAISASFEDALSKTGRGSTRD